MVLAQSTMRRLVSAPVRHAPLMVVAVTLALAYGIWYAYSVFLVALLEEFGWQRSVLAAGFSTFAVVHGFLNPAIGMVCDRVRPATLMACGGLLLGGAMWINSTINSPLELYLSFGVLTAFSVAICGWVPAVVAVERRYQRRLGLALGIVSAGVGLGMSAVVPVSQLLIDAVGWRMAFRYLGLMCVLTIVPGSIYLYRNSPKPTRAHPVETASEGMGADTATESSITLRQALGMLSFWLMVSAFLFGSMCSQTMHVHQVAFLVDHGLEAIAAATVVSVVGCASIVAKICGGWLSDKMDREIIFVVSCAILIASVGMLAWVGENPSLWGAYVYAVLLGVGYSAVAAVTPAMVSDRFSGKHYGAIFGVGLLGSASGSAFGPWMAGALFDHTGSYDLAFKVAAACGVLALFSGWIAHHVRVKNGRLTT